jgi:hypothetical protein
MHTTYYLLGFFSVSGHRTCQVTTGTATELCQRVKQYKMQPLGPPAVLPPPGGEVHQVTEMIMILKAIISRIMTSLVTDETIHEV